MMLGFLEKKDMGTQTNLNSTIMSENRKNNQKYQTPKSSRSKISPSIKKSETLRSLKETSFS